MYNKTSLVGPATVFVLVLICASAVPTFAQGTIPCNQIVNRMSPPPSLVDPYTVLVENGCTPGAMGGRTPLILIHGIGGNAVNGVDDINNPNMAYFDRLIHYLTTQDSNFSQHYKIFTFHYESDQDPYSVSDIGASLENWLDYFRASWDPYTEGGHPFDKDIVIITHSMGSLVARAMMNETRNIISSGNRAGQAAGEGVIRVITLAGLHHGTPAANGVDPLTEYDPFLLNSDVRLHGSFNPGWQLILAGIDGRFWASCPACVRGVTQVNRRDLRWASYDGANDIFAKDDPILYDENAYERNDWLKNLPSTYDSKINAYYGMIGTNGAVIGNGGDGPIDMTVALIGGCDPTGLGGHYCLSLSGIILDRIYYNAFGQNQVVQFVDNDGLVPWQSASFQGADVAKTVGCADSDHLDMEDGTGGTCTDTSAGRTGTLFKLVDADLEGLIPPPGPGILVTNPSATWDFGTVATGGLNNLQVSLDNIGGSSLTVTNLELSGTNATEFSIQGQPTLPFAVNAGASQQFYVGFQPISAGSKSAILTVYFNDGQQESTTIILSGTGGASVSCTFGQSLYVQSFGSSGGSGSFTVTAGTGCAWTATSNSSWLTVTSPAGGNGSGTQAVNFIATANSSSGLVLGEITVQGGSTTLTFLVSVDGSTQPCTYSLSSGFDEIGAGGGTSTFSIVTASSCNWSASATSPWITISNSGNHTGSGPTDFSVASNPTSSVRIGTIFVQSGSTIIVFTIQQDGGAPPVCTYSLSTSSSTIASGGQGDSFIVTTNTGCTWTLSTTGGFIQINSPTGTATGTQTVNYTVPSNPTTSYRTASIVVYGQNTSLTFSVLQIGSSGTANLQLLGSPYNLGNTLTGTTSYQTVLFKNVGDGALVVGQIYLASGSTDFSISTVPTPVLPAGGTGSFTIAFSPSAAQSESATFTFSSNDPAKPTVNFTAQATGVAEQTGGIDFTWTNFGTYPATVGTPSPATATIGNDIYVFGATNNSSAYAYDPTVNSWTSLPSMPKGLGYGGAGVINGEIYVASGTLFNGAMSIYNSTTNSWSSGTSVATPLDGPAVAAVNGKLYVIGGKDPNSGNSASGIVQIYDPSVNAWSSGTSMPTPRGYPASGVVNGIIYVIGGQDSNGVALRTVEAYDPAHDQWSTFQDMPTARSVMASAVYNNKIYVIGGTVDYPSLGSSSVVEEFDPSQPISTISGQGQWAERNPILTPRSSSVVGVVNANFYVLGGNEINVGWVSTIEQGVLNAAPVLNLPVTALDFPDTPVGDISEEDITIQNTGDALLTISYVGTGGPSDFTILNGPNSLAAGQSGTIRLRFKPSVTGTQNATYQVESNDPHNSNVSISLSGNGITGDPQTGGSSQDVGDIFPSAALSFITINNGKAYVVEGSGTMGVIDLTTGQNVGTIDLSQYAGPLGKPAFVGTLMYVPLYTSGELAVVDTGTNAVVTYLPVGTYPARAASLNSLVYISDNASWTDGHPSTVTVVDSNTNTVLSSINIGTSPLAIASDPDTNEVLVTFACQPNNPYSPGCLSFIDSSTDTVTRTLTLSDPAQDITINGGLAFVSTASTVDVVSVALKTLITSVPISGSGQGVTDAGGFVYVADMAANAVDVIDPSMDLVVTKVGLGSSPLGLAVDTNTNTVYATVPDLNKISAIRQIQPRFSLSCGASSLSVTPGTASTTTCEVKSLDGFTGPVALSFAGMPTGGSVSFSPSQITPPANGSINTTLSVTVDTTVSPGVYSFQAIGHSGAIERSGTVGISVLSVPFVGLSASSLYFGSEPLSGTTPSRVLTLTNTGNSPLASTSIAISSGNGSDFLVTGGNCATSMMQLEAGSSCTLNISFHPTAPGPRKSSVQIVDNATGSPHSVLVTGIGMAASLSPSSLTFPSQTVGTPSAPQVITLTNLGSGSMNIWEMAVLGSNASEFSTTSNCETALAAGKSCNINIIFTPGGTGTRMASFLVSDDGGGSPQSVALTGTGVAQSSPASSQSTTNGTGSSNGTSSSGTSSASSPPVGTTGGNSSSVSVVLSASTLQFGRQEVGSASSPKKIIITDTGVAPLAIRRIVFSGLGRKDFELSNNCESILGAGKSCNLELTFAPKAAGTRAAIITIEHELPGRQLRISLEGIGVQPRRPEGVSPAELRALSLERGIRN